MKRKFLILIALLALAIPVFVALAVNYNVNLTVALNYQVIASKIVQPFTSAYNYFSYFVLLGKSVGNLATNLAYQVFTGKAVGGLATYLTYIIFKSKVANSLTLLLSYLVFTGKVANSATTNLVYKLYTGQNVKTFSNNMQYYIITCNIQQNIVSCDFVSSGGQGGGGGGGGFGGGGQNVIVPGQPMFSWVLAFTFIATPALILARYAGGPGLFIGLIIGIGIAAMTGILPFWFIILLVLGLLLLLAQGFRRGSSE